MPWPNMALRLRIAERLQRREAYRRAFTAVEVVLGGGVCPDPNCATCRAKRQPEAPS